MRLLSIGGLRQMAVICVKENGVSKFNVYVDVYLFVVYEVI
jgi:hypothetical protein